jgi:hypothetical protein
MTIILIVNTLRSSDPKISLVSICDICIPLSLLVSLLERVNVISTVLIHSLMELSPS